MIIKDIRLTNFGKFNHKMVTLESGVNIIYGENEAGKTTLHTFIRGMLFGIEKQRGKASGKDLYSKYEPWENPANYQGMMRIESNGVNYRIERNFNKEHKSFKVINEDLGKELTENEIEELFSGLDESCYYNTISISQLGSVTDRELETILKNYAANLGATKSMEIDIKAAYTDLDAQRKKIISENKIGEEESILKEIKNARDQLEISEREQHTIIASIEQKKEVAAKIMEQKNELSVMDAKRLEELAKQNERKDNLYQEVMNLTADSEKYAVSLEKIQNHKNELEQQLAAKGIDSPETMEWLTDKIINKSNMPVAFIILMMACIGTAIGSVVGNLNLIYLKKFWIRPAICLAGAVMFLILAVIKYLFNRKKRTKKLEALKELKLVMDKLDAAKHEEVYVKRQLDNKKESLRNAQEMIQAEEERNLEAQDYSEELKELEGQEREINEAVSKAQWVLEQKQEKDIETEKYIEELLTKHEKIKNAKIEIAAIESAKQNIEEIANEIRNSFGKKLNERASYYISKITNGKYDNLSIDEKLNISINSRHALISSSKLSKGTVEQIYMALRLAAADIIFEQDKKPILLDDAFAMYDNKRMGNTMQFMAENMEQVIIFSCHTREKLMAEKLGIDYNFIRL
jgi:uncharacterized protein YhaN